MSAHLLNRDLAIQRLQAIKAEIRRLGVRRLALFGSVLRNEARLRAQPGSHRRGGFPWRGQFSPQFVESFLRAYASPGATVLDPFMGSGMVLIEAVRLGMAAHGYEINPAAYLLSRVYELCSLAHAERRALLDSAEAVLTRARPSAFELPLFRSQSADAPTTVRGSLGIPDAIDPRVRMRPPPTGDSGRRWRPDELGVLQPDPLIPRYLIRYISLSGALPSGIWYSS